MNETKVFAGADETTPSVAQYFTWINNTNEGATEKQTLINLAFFQWMKKTYGMQIDIYAWDAGNIDGSAEGYGSMESEKFRKQYPSGFQNVLNITKQAGIRLGIWAGADGFGDTEEEEKDRSKMMIRLCRECHFKLFKFDQVCGSLRPEKQECFAEMMRECRKYSPDLIALNHRVDFGKAAPYLTTFLWEGQETYIDVHLSNKKTAPHNREGALERGFSPELKRLTEDHGVCLSSCLDYFEDDLILQAFNRALILSPEIYGNPWLLRDDEFSRLARIFNLQKQYAPILVEGITLPSSYGKYAVSRGNAETRLLTLRNIDWKTLKIEIALNQEIGLTKQGQVSLLQYHPTECLLGNYSYGQRVMVEIPPFRSALFLVSADSVEQGILSGCEYQVIRDADSQTYEVEVLRGGDIRVIGDKFTKAILEGEECPQLLNEGIHIHVDAVGRPPQYLGRLQSCEIPENAEFLYETTCFALDNESLEARSLQRAGKTCVPEVQAARDAFFEQKTYRFRGCESRFMFDGKEDTFFDGISKYTGLRVEGGCLRVDFGLTVHADSVRIRYFSIDQPVVEIPEQNAPECIEYSVDKCKWITSVFIERKILDSAFQAPVVTDETHIIRYVSGSLCQVVYALDNPIRYLRLPDPMDRIYEIDLIRDGQCISLNNPKANNLMAHYSRKHCIGAQSGTIFLEDFRQGSYLSIALDGIHGIESAYCVAVCEGQAYGCPSRSVSYPSNVWEYRVISSDRNTTYYLPLEEAMKGRKICIYTLLCEGGQNDFETNVYLCEPKQQKGVKLTLFR